MNETPWRQVTIAYPGQTRREREQHAIPHLNHVLPAAEVTGHINSWWFIRKGPWRIRYLPAHPHHDPDPIHRLLTESITWTTDIYEPETHAFGGPDAMDAAHHLFHHDSRHLITYLHRHPRDRREQSLILCTTLMRAAGLDLDEQGDVWARIEQERAQLLHQMVWPSPDTWATFTANVSHLLLGTPRTTTQWHTAFETTGATLQALRATGRLTRGIRAITAKHVIFHWNRIGIPATSQALLAHAATHALLGQHPPHPTAPAARHGQLSSASPTAPTTRNPRRRPPRPSLRALPVLRHRKEA